MSQRRAAAGVVKSSKTLVVEPIVTNDNVDNGGSGVSLTSLQANRNNNNSSSNNNSVNGDSINISKMNAIKSVSPGSFSLETDRGGGSDDDNNDYGSDDDDDDHSSTGGGSRPEDTAMLSAEDRFETERHKLRLKQWRESPFACGFTEATWMEERLRQTRSSGQARAYGDDELQRDSSGCLCFSAVVCPWLQAGRVGNMAVLHSTQEWVEECEHDEETGQIASRRFLRPRLTVVVGPFWPMLVFVTYPLIFAVSGWAFYAGIWKSSKPKPILFIFVWFLLTGGLILSLALTACRDPGILYRYKQPPPQAEGSWRWSDAAQTFRPRYAQYDPDTAVVVEEFDHTCPWTGTAIGRRNMLSFQTFVCLVFLCMVMDIFVITGAM